MKQINIGIPEKKDFIRWAKILRFKLTGGFSCTKCGGKSNFNHVLFDSKVNVKRLMVSNSTPGICADCTIKELNEKEDIVFTEQDCECDWCGKPKMTMSFPRHEALESKVTFGGMWWNGHHICRSCLNIGFGHRGQIYSNRVKHKNGIVYNYNELGLWIKMK